jgi:hypothetical protein
VQCERVKLVDEVPQLRKTLVDVRSEQAHYLELCGQPRALAEQVDVVMGRPRGKRGLEGSSEAGGVYLEPGSGGTSEDFLRQNETS